MLTKPGIVFGNAITAAGGFALGSQGNLDLFLLCISLLGLSLIVASGCVSNNYLDRISDQKMTRTQNRPLARGIISPKKALFFAGALLSCGILLLFFYTNLLTVSIACIGFLVYVLFYSILKYKTVYGTAIGSIAGAVPPVVGYCAISGKIDLGAILLFSMVCLWQMPHFFAIALYRLPEYASASIPVLPLVKGERLTKIRMFYYVIAFTLVSCLLKVCGYVGYSYLIVALIAGGSWIWICWQGLKSDENKEGNQNGDKLWARKMFLSSLLVILCICFMMGIDRVS